MKVSTSSCRSIKVSPSVTVEPLNKGHFGSSHTVLYTEVVLCSEAEKHYSHNIGAKKGVHYWEIVLCSEGPLSEVQLYSCIYFALSLVCCN